MCYLGLINPNYLCEFNYQQITLQILIIHLRTRIRQHISTITYNHFSEHWYSNIYWLTYNSVESNGKIRFQFHVYLVASKCSRNHFIAEESVTIQSYKLRFLQNIPFAQLYNAASDWKVLEAFLEAVLWKPFQLFRRILNKIRSITESSMRISFEEKS